MKTFDIGEFYCGPGGLGLAAKLQKLQQKMEKLIHLTILLQLIMTKIHVKHIEGILQAIKRLFVLTLKI